MFYIGIHCQNERFDLGKGYWISKGYSKYELVPTYGENDYKKVKEEWFSIYISGESRIQIFLYKLKGNKADRSKTKRDQTRVSPFHISQKTT